MIYVKKSTYLILIVLFSSCQVVLASFPDYGQVRPEDFNPELNSTEKDGVAVILSKEGSIRVEKRGDGRFFVRKVESIKFLILKKGGVNLGTQTFRTNSREDVAFLYAATHNLENGKVESEEIKKENLIRESLTWSRSKYTMNFTNVKVGSILEMTLSRSFYSSGYAPIYEWNLQDNYPVIINKLNFYYPTGINFKVMVSKVNHQSDVYFANDIAETKKGINSVAWELKHVPAVKMETFLPGGQKPSMTITFEMTELAEGMSNRVKLNGTWNDVDRSLKEFYGWGRQRKGLRLFSKIAENFNGSDSDEIKLERAYDYFTSEFSWDGDHSLQIAEDIKEVYTEKRGNSSELNILFLDLLESCGIEANPVLIGTRSHAFVDTLNPLIGAFNHTILAVRYKGKRIFVDTTDPELPLGTLPFESSVSVGRIYEGGEGKFVPVTSEGILTIFWEEESTFDINNSSMFSKLRQSQSGLAGLEARRKLKSLTYDQIKDLMVRNIFSDVELQEFIINGRDKEDEPLVMEFEVVQDESLFFEDYIYVTPFSESYMLKNPFIETERENDIDFVFKVNTSQSLKYKIPEGYEVESMPESLNLTLEGGGGRFTFSSEKIGDSAVLVSRLVVSKTYFFVNQYPVLREFFDRVVQKHAEQLILRRLDR